MRVTGRRGHMHEVPGTCNIGKMGVTFDYPQVRRRRGDRSVRTPVASGLRREHAGVRCFVSRTRERTHTMFL